MVYRAYLRSHDGHVPDETKTITHDATAAFEAFSGLVGRTDLDGQKFAAALTCNNKQIAFHRFDRAPDSPDYWRGRLDDIAWPGAAPSGPGSGGARAGAGRKSQTTDGGPLRHPSVSLDDTTILILTKFGDGQLSEGIRRAARVIGENK